MTLDIRRVDLGALNSATKYPSIPTYHRLDPGNGGLLDETVPFHGDVIGTEKLDGTNSRIVSLPGEQYVIGSREELLYARGDLIGNPALGIVAALRDLADRVGGTRADEIVVYYLEVYGGKVTAASREYTGNRAVGYRMFDAARVSLDVLEWPRERISHWRDNGGQGFLDEGSLTAVAQQGRIEMTPRLFVIDAAELPMGIEETRVFLGKHAAHTLATLDDDGNGRAEGIVMRTADRSVIAKARFQDYDRTIKRRTAVRRGDRGHEERKRA
jgi:hypothetical protein